MGHNGVEQWYQELKTREVAVSARGAVAFQREKNTDKWNAARCVASGGERSKISSRGDSYETVQLLLGTLRRLTRQAQKKYGWRTR